MDCDFIDELRRNYFYTNQQAPLVIYFCHCNSSSSLPAHNHSLPPNGCLSMRKNSPYTAPHIGRQKLYIFICRPLATEQHVALALFRQRIVPSSTIIQTNLGNICLVTRRPLSGSKATLHQDLILALEVEVIRMVLSNITLSICT